jgi:hypothetical protein
VSTKYTKWEGKRISKPKPKGRAAALDEEAQEIAEAHRQLKEDFLAREKKRQRARARQASGSSGCA